MSAIENFFNKKRVFITGATGFVGKVLIEKLLRSCESIETIYILIRAKHNESAQQRYTKYINHLVFDRLKKESPSALGKLKVISGDVKSFGLNVSDEDGRELIEKTQVVFHCAAVVRFDFSLFDIMKNNVEGTYHVLQFAERMRQLEAFVFVSTAFSQSYQFSIEEKYYPTGFDILALLDCIQANDKAAIDEVEKEMFRRDHPSTYTMSKAFAEELINYYGNKLPVVIVRPSIIVGAYVEPEPGFVQGYQSTTGLMAGSIGGVFRNALADDKVALCMIPVDYVVNCMISAAWRRSIEKHEQCLFINSDAGTNQITWAALDKKYRSISLKYVSADKLFWYPSTFATANYGLYLVLFLFTQLVPAMLFDFCLLLAGKKAFMTKLQKKIYTASMDFSRFTKNNFKIEITKMQELYREMDEDDKKKFNFDVEQINWYSVLETQLQGIRKYVFLEDESTIPKAQAKLRKLYIMDVGLKMFIGISLLYFVYRRFF